MIITPEFINSTSAGLSLLYISEMFTSEIPWAKCVFERVTNSCVKAVNQNTDSGEVTILKCDVEYQDVPTFSALNYLRFATIMQK